MRWDTYLIRAFSLYGLVATAVAGPRSVAAAPQPRIGLDQETVVICAKYANNPTTREANCQTWVDRFNAEVRPWFETVSDGTVSFRFKLPTYHAEATPPSGHWFTSTIQRGQSNFVGNLDERVFQQIDSLVDLSDTHRVVVVIPAPGAWGQAGGRPNLDSATNLSTNDITVSAPSEREFDRQLSNGTMVASRKISLVMLFENNVQNPPSQGGVDQTSMVLIHELNHLFGFPERYRKLANGSRDVATGYSPMGSTGVSWGRVHHLAFDQFRTGQTQNGAPLRTITKSQTNVSVDLVPLDLVSPPTSARSIVLLPLSQSSGPADFEGYVVEARRSGPGTGDNPLQTGVLVTYVDTKSFGDDGLDIVVMDDPSIQNGNWDLALEVGDVFADNARGVRVEVGPALAPWTGGYSVTIDNTEPAAPYPDMRIERWRPDWGSADIWVDSPTNGFDPGHQDPPAVRETTSDPPIENRLYFRVRNDGGSDAHNVVARAYFALAGVGQQDWTLINTLQLGSITGGQERISYLNWQVPDAVLSADHGCLKVVIDPVPNELNLNNNSAQENVFEFETVHNSPWHSRSQPILVQNPSQTESATIALSHEGLPQDWAIRLVPPFVHLPPGGAQMIDFAVFPSGDPANPHELYDTGFVGKVILSARAYYEDRAESLGGVSVSTRLTDTSAFSPISASISGGGATLSSCLSSQTGFPLGEEVVALQVYSAASGKQMWSYPKTGADGCFEDNISILESGTWQVVAYFAGYGAKGTVRETTTVTIP